MVVTPPCRHLAERKSLQTSEPSLPHTQEDHHSDHGGATGAGETAGARSMRAERSYTSQRSSTSPAKSRLTFTKPPQTHQARPHPRDNRTHLPDKLRDIERDNHILVNHIAEIGAKQTTFAQQNPYYSQSGAPASMSSAAINRKKQAEKVRTEPIPLHPYTHVLSRSFI